MGKPTSDEMKKLEVRIYFSHASTMLKIIIQ